jgi:hypothetical protein
MSTEELGWDYLMAVKAKCKDDPNVAHVDLVQIEV